jgi:hypothetical protein
MLTCYRDRVGLPLHLGAHQPHHLGKAHISLQGIAATALHGDGAPSDSCTGKEVGGGRGITFYIGGARGYVGLTRWDVQVLQAV